LGDVFNIGGVGDITIKKRAELVIKETGSSAAIEMVPYEKAYRKGFEDTMRRIPDSSKIKALTGWAPKKSLKEIIHDVAAQMKSES
ncbi:MAG: nucleoside-diphosphate sugar epimerase, partial [Candidatus Nanopelagicaceae bacterium]